MAAQIANGDQRAFITFFDRHGGLAYGLALAILHDTCLAEDAVERAFLAFWRSPQRNGLTELRPRTLIVSLVHREAVRVRRERQPTEPQVPGPLADTFPRLRNPLGALASLSEEEREALLAAYYTGLTPRKAGQTEHTEGSSLGSKAQAALTHLAAAIEQQRAQHASPSSADHDQQSLRKLKVSRWLRARSRAAETKQEA